MCREQGIRIVGDLSRLTLPSERKINFEGIAGLRSNSEVKNMLLKDDTSFTALQQELSLDLIDLIEKSGQRTEMRKFFMPPGVFDGIINVLVLEFAKKPIRPHLCDPSARKALIEQFVGKI